MTIYLASKSPRRRMLLEKLGLNIQLIEPMSDDLAENEVDPVKYTKDKAIKKAKSVLDKVDEKAIIIAADTIVMKGKEILEKPKDKEDAIQMLTKLSGTSHFVYTAVVVLEKTTKKMEVEVEKTKVEMRKISKEEIQRYVDSGEPLDAAGAYKIQEKGMKFIKRIEGCFYNVIGLPVATLVEMLKKFNIEL